jgi:hypothetical protein
MPSQMVSDITTFYKVVTDLYNENMATSLGVVPSVPVCDAMSNFFLNVCGELNDEWDEHDKIVASISLLLPPHDALLTLGFRIVGRAQATSEFKQYRDELRRWRLTQTPQARGAMLEALTRYAGIVSTECGSKDYQEPIQAEVRGAQGFALDMGFRLMSSAAGYEITQSLGNTVNHFAGTLIFALSCEAIKGGIEKAVDPLHRKARQFLVMRRLRPKSFDVAVHRSGSLEVLLPATLHPIVPKLASSDTLA